MTLCRGIRGATTAEENTKEAIFFATKELVSAVVEANDVGKSQVAAAFFTTTQDLNAAFPATVVRMELGWDHIALMCSHEMTVPDSLPKCIRVLVLVNTEKEAHELVNVYLKDAVNLRARTTG
jgi:chorismate mutase